MTFKPSIDKMFAGKQSRYALVIGVAKRAREIAEEIEQTNSKETRKPVNLAIKDFKDHKYEIVESIVSD